MEADSLISHDVLARYAADAAGEVEGVAGLGDGRGKSVSVSGDEDTLAVTLALRLEWGHSAAEVAREVQKQVSDYLARMAKVTPGSVDVLFDSVSPPPAKR